MDHPDVLSPSSWLQYGAFGLLALLLVGFAFWAAKWLFPELLKLIVAELTANRNAIEEITDKFTIAMDKQQTLFRAESEEQRKILRDNLTTIANRVEHLAQAVEAHTREH